MTDRTNPRDDADGGGALEALRRGLIDPDLFAGLDETCTPAHCWQPEAHRHDCPAAA